MVLNCHTHRTEVSNESNGAFPQVHRHHLGNLLPRVTNNPPAGMHIQMLLLHIQLQVPDFPRKVERPEVVAETEHWIEYHGGFSWILMGKSAINGGVPPMLTTAR